MHKVLVVSPIHLNKGVGEVDFDPEFDEFSVETSHELAKEYEDVSRKHGVAFLDASLISHASEDDREHMDETNHALLATAISNKVREVLA